MRICKNDQGAFSLIELLAVIAIMALLAGIATPAITQTVRASRLSVAGQTVVDELNFARQTALSRNTAVEVRFYKLPDYDNPPTSTPSVYRAIQSFLIDSGGASPLDKPKYFSAPVTISIGVAESPFFSSISHPEQTAPSNFNLPGYGNSYAYRSFQFSSRGSADVLSSENYFTLTLKNGKPVSQGTNFFTIQVYPITGSIQSYRP